MAAPPRAREGGIAASAGRPVVCGVAPFLREVSVRASAADLWASLDALTVEPGGLDRLARHHSVTLDSEARRRFPAFIAQAKQYYLALRRLDSRAKPLFAYYFALNMAKAFLTAVDPATTESDTLYHGLSSSREEKRRYYFQQEKFRIRDNGVFRLLAERTGQDYCYAAGYEIRVVDLLRYLPEGYELHADATGSAPSLLPVDSCSVLFGNREGWLRIEIDRNTLRQRNIGPASVPKRATSFGNRFRLVASEAQTASFESINAFAYSRKRTEILEGLCQEFDAAMLMTQRNSSAQRHFLVLSDRAKLLSQESVAFAMFHHLSSMVRYRPHHVERVRGTKYFWLFAVWVDRAAENFLLSLASRITGEEHRFVG